MNTGEAFVCTSDEEMISLVERYAKDEVFYTKQVKECRKRSERLRDIDTKGETEKVISFVRRYAEGIY